ncbi:MAG TPA: hypothetical protein VGO47_09915 [Chlamydiales bacterium]|nr:hypothetical protein [Chlamydiales bacterium]
MTQSDPGTENYGIAKAQTYLRHRLDPSLEGTLQHKFRYKVNNIKPEVEWSLLRRFLLERPTTRLRGPRRRGRARQQLEVIRDQGGTLTEGQCHLRGINKQEIP